MLAEGRVGPVISDADRPLRLGRDGAGVVVDAHGRYYEAASRGNIYVSSNQSGVTTPAGLSTSPTTVTLFNPKGSGINGVIIYAGITFTVAFAAAAVVWIGLNTNIAAVDVTGTLATIRNCLLGNSKAPAILAVTAATLPAAPVAGPILGVGLTGAITTAPGELEFGREFAGSLVLSPGSAVSFQTSTASGASAAFGEFIWEEVPV